MERGKKDLFGNACWPSMPRTLSETPEASNDPARVCGECRRAKTIRGVWYLVPGRATPFVCEACFGARPVLRAVG